MADIANVADPQDIVEIGGMRRRRKPRAAEDVIRTPKFLSIWFRCCHTYGRLYRNRAGTKYEGPCPKCGARVYARIGPGGTKQRIFEAR